MLGCMAHRQHTIQHNALCDYTFILFQENNPKSQPGCSEGRGSLAQHGGTRRLDKTLSGIYKQTQAAKLVLTNGNPTLVHCILSCNYIAIFSKNYFS